MEILREIERTSGEENTYVPIISPDVAQLLKFLIRTHRFCDILEIGTGTGYSALTMLSVEEVRITTIERYAERVVLARKNFARAGVTDRVRLIEGDCMEIVPCLTKKYDMIFMDAAKGQYINLFPHVLNLVRKDGMIVTDDVLYKGMVRGDEPLLKRKDTIVKRLRQYLQLLEDTPDTTTIVLPIGDGVALTGVL